MTLALFFFHPSMNATLKSNNFSHIENKTEPRVEPLGAPHERGAGTEQCHKSEHFKASLYNRELNFK